ncbi:MAG TPA: polyribonucleotide nucleotidyltransferase [Algoriphagus sp.]|jgi:polyribonucleotide nucleotidyltransferase|uniref:polyribonucleotide nucleotidyltransferase n=3 Tax=Algoriphagus TaxID=246875 RepID=UPI000C5EC577|nr:MULTISPECIES: polyribonucleotide nucleotidyltransferase [unclassified Algoriphagus]MAL11989.1 polyribonucleotide nucleotidyltransferase [Algoriphagus sp.]MAN87385.1 polyribonucleotide nucleotidyltransferase [Algoriphagus sp.]QYH38594.1 polyribonucleotide nucleotidyltransferase [Algoriphagus sp. NBT04N3]HAH38559.1 polyribonucleotide nucleotidyltransferase [Algoriphagus sp.]HCH43763.1 polyribonucleotide nucleotidyltransferase [Algoriphagus sp.]|tara:strand:- start:180 stop:2327 length:2148 start_codon:yes stop_codon:yes gene_type:complete
MLPNLITKTITLQDGREITIETGALAKQADGSVVVRMGKAMLLATVVSKKEALEGVDFLPLSVDYQEKFAASGKIPGGFLKREGRLSDYEILISRIVDRAIRPIFPDDYHADTQVAITLMSSDEEVLPDALAGLAASAALAVSDIPFNGPISEVRVAKVDGKLIINPKPVELEKASLEFIVAGSLDYILMVEGEANEISEDEMVEAMQFAHEEIKRHCEAQMELTKLVGKEEKREYSHEKSDPALYDKMKAELYDKLYNSVSKQIANKSERSELIKAIKDEFVESLGEEHEFEASLIGPYFHKIHKEAARNLTLNEKKRLDGRKLNEIRPIWSVVDYLPSAHGSAVFTRGETQSVTTCTLGTKMDEQMVDGAVLSGFNKFFLHYNFPGFSTGEVKPNRGPGRREVGHGNLAMRALKKVLPPENENPYTIRIVSDILESNGSSSMATVCAGSLALMDAGIQIKAPVTGIAMGMISDAKTGNYSILSDILGDEDHLGDMDFKVTGTEKGITACQMDLKVEGLDYSVLKEALYQAKEGRLHILEEISKTLATPKSDLKPHTPRSYTMMIPKELIGAVIGPGGKVIQEMQKDTNTTIVIEEIDNQGKINVFSANQDNLNAALSRIKAIVAQPEIGETYTGKVKNIQPFGAFVEFMPGKDGLLHISEIKWERLESMDGVLEPGEEIVVKLIDVDKKTGKFKLSRKVLLPKPEKQEPKAQS